MAIEDHYKRRHISRCSCVDSLYVIWAFSQLMQVRQFQFPDNIEKYENFLADSRVNYMIHEWELETIATEVILHAERAPNRCAIGQRSQASSRSSATLKRTVRRQRRCRHLCRDGAYHASADCVAAISSPDEAALSLTSYLQRSRSGCDLPRGRRPAGGCPVLPGCLGVWRVREGPHAETWRHHNLRYPTVLQFAARPLAELRQLIGDVHRLDHAYAYQVGPLREFPPRDGPRPKGRPSRSHAAFDAGSHRQGRTSRGPPGLLGALRGGGGGCCGAVAVLPSALK